jgi:hypothetical protein
MLALAVVGRGWIALGIAWLLVGLIVISYLRYNGRLAEHLLDAGLIWMSLDFFEAILASICFVGLHHRILRRHALSDIR